MVHGKKNARSFRIFCEQQDDDLVVPLSNAINTAFIHADRYFKQNRGTGAAAVDVSQFFKNRRNHHKHFEAFWDSESTAAHATFEQRLEKVRDAIAAVEA
ncbi:MAG: hypothetical protein ABIP48_32295 [Planctomycetota bacterium]